MILANCMTLANAITLGRLCLIPLVLALLIVEQRALSLTGFLVFLVGDVLDGAAARWRGEVTALGKFLDPLADKVLAAGLLATFAARGELSWWGFSLLAFQQVGLLAGMAVLLKRSRGQLLVIEARPSGKAAAAVLAAALAALYLRWPGAQEALYLGIALSYGAALDYLWVGWRKTTSHKIRAPNKT